MNRSRVIRSLYLTLVLGLLGILIGSGVALASWGDGSDLSATTTAQPADQLTLSCTYPVLRQLSGETFEFAIDLTWNGSASRRFDLGTTVPPKWTATILREYEDREVAAIELTPGKSIPDRVRVRLTPVSGATPDPGEYIVTLTVSSVTIKQSIELKAIVTALYRFAFFTASGRLSTEVTAGQTNRISLNVQNTGTAALDKITFTSSKPSGWNVTFTPDEVTGLAPNTVKEVTLVIEPPAKTIAGDYMITVRALAGNTNVSSPEIEFRVTVLAPTVWGWVGIIIVLVVIAGIGFIFRRLGRR